MNHAKPLLLAAALITMMAAPVQANDELTNNRQNFQFVADVDDDGIRDIIVWKDPGDEGETPGDPQEVALTYATVGYNGICRSSTGWTCNVGFTGGHGVRTVGHLSTGTGTLQVTAGGCFAGGGGSISCTDDCAWGIGDGGCGTGEIRTTVKCGETVWGIATTTSNFGSAGNAAPFTNSFC